IHSGLMSHHLTSTSIYVPHGRHYHLRVFTPPPPAAIYTLSLHDALPISARAWADDQRDHRSRDRRLEPVQQSAPDRQLHRTLPRDRKSTRLNSSHQIISYAVFCLKKKKISLVCSILTQ